MNTLYSQFQQALKREKQTITTFYSGDTYPCLFRKIDDNKNTSNHVEIFYDASSPIEQGQLLIKGGKTFITLNKESIENETYYKSALRECNLTVPVYIEGIRTNIPCYSFEQTSAYLVESNVMSYVDGKGELLTELIPELSTTASYISTGLYIMGGYYKCANLYVLNNTVHIMIERELAPADVYEVTLTSNETVHLIETTEQLITSATKNFETDPTAVITYSSSNEAIATISATGFVTYIAVGSVTFTATWAERSATDTLDIIVTTDGSAPTFTMTITQSGDLLIGGVTRTFTPTLFDTTDTVVTAWTAVWSFIYPDDNQTAFHITYSGNNCLVKVDEVYSLLGKTLTLNCTTSDNVASATYNITITSGW